MNRDSHYMRFPDFDSCAEYIWNLKGTKHIYVTVARKYGFKFTLDGRLVSIDDATLGTWDTLTKKKDKDAWIVRKSKVYYGVVIPCLKQFMSKTA